LGTIAVHIFLLTPGQVYRSKPVATPPAQKKRPKSRSSATPSPEPSVAASPSLEEFVPTAAAEGTEKTNEGPRVDFETIRARAESGDADCQYQLGLRCQTGDGVAKDFPEAIKWYRKAADQGFVAAQSALALCYFHGAGVRKDFTEAVNWARKAADHGDAGAQDLLGFAYYYGEGVGKDPAERVNWFRKAADQNHHFGEINLGICYESGIGVGKNYTEAVNWYRKAAEQNYARAQVNLARCYHDGIGVRKDYVEAVKWLRKAAEQNYAKAEGLLGQWYEDGKGVSKNYEEAVNWYRKAADQKDPVAQWRLAGYYYNGKGVPKNYIECYKWLLLSAAQGDERARKATPIVERALSPNQIAEGQRLARDFKPGEIRPTGTAISETNVSEAQPTASGTGFFITEDGYVVTNEHVARNSARVQLLTASGLVPAKVIRVDGSNDLALLKAQQGKFEPLAVAPSRIVKLGTTVATIGFLNIGLQGFAPKFAKGDIAALTGFQDDPRFFQISVPVQPGNSGGALVDERGNAIGIVSAKLNPRATLMTSGSLPENVNYAVKSSFLLGFLESVPEVASKLKQPNDSDTKFSDAIEEAKAATVLVLVY
jgi:TPR repeat protein